ncbi:Polyamine aminopropyltransferase [Bienertia sinuspersici]
MGEESLSSDFFMYKFAYNRRGRTVAEFLFNDFCSTPSCLRKIGPLPTFELLTPSPTTVSAYSITSTLDAAAIVTEEILAKDISVTDNAIDDGSYSSIDQSARTPDVVIPEFIRKNPPEKVKEYIDLVEEENAVEYNDVSRLSIDEHNPAVIEKSEELRHTLESSVLLNIINLANPDIHVYMAKTDFPSLAPKTWLTGASIDACSYVFNRREEEKPGNPRRFWFNILLFNYINWLIDERKKVKIESIIAEREIDLEKAKDNPCYDTMKAEWTIPFSWRSNQNDFDCGDYCIKAMEWYDGGNKKKHPITTLSTVCLYKEFNSMPSCYRFGKLQRKQKETGSFEGLCFVVYNKAISHSTTDKEKG